ncbi:MAG: hypothetical protein IJO63_04195 [Bacilli bacterium]|nr:hypothetical protein [Bacilli bacterium]
MNIPIVTLDKIYVKPDEKNIFFLDCTRVSGSNKIISRKKESLNMQIIRVSNSLNGNEIILADDVVFSGNVLKNIINRFSIRGITVVGIISSICSSEAYEYFNRNLKYGLRTKFIMSEDVIDQICERDFYFGVAGSGIMINSEEGLCKAPYFKPYGDSCERASIPKEYENYFSTGCLERSLYLWDDVDNTRGSSTKISELPERIINTKSEDEVVKTLRRELRR